MKTRKNYTAEFKREVVRLVTDEGYKAAEAARSLGIDLRIKGRALSAVRIAAILSSCSRLGRMNFLSADVRGASAAAVSAKAKKTVHDGVHGFRSIRAGEREVGTLLQLLPQTHISPHECSELRSFLLVTTFFDSNDDLSMMLMSIGFSAGGESSAHWSFTSLLIAKPTTALFRTPL